jgi:hypothetical protein
LGVTVGLPGPRHPDDRPFALQQDKAAAAPAGWQNAYIEQET